MLREGVDFLDQIANGSVELRHLRYFVAVCDSGGISEAAKQLNIAPTTVYRHVRKLEGLLNVKLLIRTGRRITNTD